MSNAWASQYLIPRVHICATYSIKRIREPSVIFADFFLMDNQRIFPRSFPTFSQLFNRLGTAMKRTKINAQQSSKRHHCSFRIGKSVCIKKLVKPEAHKPSLCAYTFTRRLIDVPDKQTYSQEWRKITPFFLPLYTERRGYGEPLASIGARIFKLFRSPRINSKEPFRKSV